MTGICMRDVTQLSNDSILPINVFKTCIRHNNDMNAMRQSIEKALAHQ